MTWIQSGLLTLAGVVIGFALNVLKDYFFNRPKLSFCLEHSLGTLWEEPWKRTKTSESDFLFDLYNCGHVPVVIKEIGLYHGDKLLTAMYPLDFIEIMPYKVFKERMSMQEYDSLQYHGKKLKLKDCKVVAIDIQDNEIKGKLDLTLISIELGRMPK